MKKLLFASAALVGLSSMSFADINEQMKDSQYCRDNSYDIICMGPEMQTMRTKMMEMNKETAMAARTKYCQGGTGATDPICDPKMMNDATGY